MNERNAPNVNWPRRNHYEMCFRDSLVSCFSRIPEFKFSRFLGH